LAKIKIKIVPSPDVGRLRKNHIQLVVMPIGQFMYLLHTLLEEKLSFAIYFM
jgi:hypothetical protein